MAYTATTWVENVTTLGPTNLNKLETAVTKVPYGPDFSANNVPVWNGSVWVAQKIAEAQITAGTITNASINASAAIDVSKLAGAYSTYTPTWTSSGTAPAIGNATIIARYLQIGKMVHAHGRITFGSSSTFGTGTYAFALPVTGSANITILGLGAMFDSSANALGTAEVSAASTTTMALNFGATYLGTSTSAGQTTPWTWAVSDQILWNVTYEAA